MPTLPNKDKKYASVAQIERDEYQVLELVARGLHNKEIAEELHQTAEYVDNVMDGLFRRTGGMNRVKLAVWFTKYQCSGGGRL